MDCLPLVADQDFIPVGKEFIVITFLMLHSQWQLQSVSLKLQTFLTWSKCHKIHIRLE